MTRDDMLMVVGDVVLGGCAVAYLMSTGVGAFASIAIAAAMSVVAMIVGPSVVEATLKKR